MLKKEIDMLSTKELFKVDPIHFKDMKYKQVLLIKKQIAKDLIKNELAITYQQRDYHRITELSKAIKNMDKLLNELKEQKCTTSKNKTNLLQLPLQFLNWIKTITKK